MSQDEKGRKRHCWECRRLSLVCDSDYPACRRCVASGTVCPGYTGNQPQKLKWLAPGRVKSRKSKTKRTGSVKSEISLSNCSALSLNKHARESCNQMMTLPAIELRTDICDLSQAAQYFNACIYSDLMPIHEMGHNPNIYSISPQLVKAAVSLPEFLAMGMVCMTLSHRINRTREELQSSSLVQSFYRYRGKAIRSLSESISDEKKCTSDAVIAGILTLLLADIQQSSSGNWRDHLSGIRKIIALRGNIQSLASSESSETLLSCFLFTGIFGNTTSPAVDLAMADLHAAEVEFILKHYGNDLSPFHMCPLPLVVEIIRINHIRSFVSHESAGGAHVCAKEAEEILQRILELQLDGWAETKPYLTGDWLLVGKIYQAATILYCVLAFQSVSIMPQSAHLRRMCAQHGRLLHELLEWGLSSSRVKIFLLWPLVVLGVEAVYAGATLREFVSNSLPHLSRYAGTYVPLAAQSTLQSFWTTGSTSWDSCFDRPCSFTIQVTVDTAGLLATR